MSAPELAEDDTRAAQSYADRMRGIVAHLAGSFHGGAVNLMCLHTHMDGAVLHRSQGSERRVHLGDDWAATPQGLPSHAHYIALGHIHKPQAIYAPSPARYAGSVMQLDFGEAGEEKSFVVVDAEPGRPARVERVPYEGGRSLRTLRAPLKELEQRSADLRAERSLLRVVVQLDAPDPDLNRKVRALLPDAVSVDVELPAAEGSAPPRVSLAENTPREVFEAYYRERHGREPGGGLLDAFDTLYQQAGDGQ